MTMSKLIVGVDHSDRSDKATRRAGQLAEQRGGELVLVYALDVGMAERLGGLIQSVASEETEARAKAALQQIPFQVRVMTGRPFEALRDAAKELDADLVVLGVHRREEIEPGVGGSTARRLINVAPAPVLVVTADSAAAYKNILVGFDGSPAACDALRVARELAPDAHFTIVNAVMIPFSARKMKDELVGQFEQDARRMVRETLGGEPHNTEIVARAGEAYGVLREEVEARKPDLLVLGTSMPALYRTVFGGGIVDLIAADPPCDLLVVKR